MNAVVLVGGEGTRLRPLTYTTPKQLLPVAEVPLLERVLTALARHGVDHVVLSLGYRPDAFRNAYPTGSAAGVRLSYAVEDEPLDTAGAIRYAAREAELSETFLVVNGDVLTDLDVSELVSFHLRRGAMATIALTPVEDPSRFGVVPTEPDGRVVAFVEKPPPGEAPTNYINAGTYVVEPDVLEHIPAGRRVSVERETFPALVADGSLFALASDAYWLDAGTPEAYLRANADVLTGKRGPSPAPGAEAVSEGVWITGSPQLAGDLRPASLVAHGARLEGGCVVESSVIGARAVVGPSAVVSGSVLLAGAEVAEGAQVRGSILGHGAKVGPGARLDPISIVGDGASVAEGAHLVGARLPSAV